MSNTFQLQVHSCSFISVQQKSLQVHHSAPHSAAMHSNVSSALLLTLATLGLSDAHIYPAFLCVTLTYLFILFCNLLVLITIARSAKLHKPMFVLVFNLIISDMIGATAFFPQLILSILTKSRVISYSACIIQAFLIHFYGTANLLTMSVMAYDRYVAICNPLRYKNIMTLHNLGRLITMIWIMDLSVLLVLFLLLVRFRFCRTDIDDLFCNNPSLMKLACGDTTVNSYYGMTSTVLYQGGILSIIIFTYTQILRTCLMTNQAIARRKALQTCSPQLITYFIFEINIFFSILSTRFNDGFPFLRKALAVSVVVVSPLLDPMIYGLQIRELRLSFQMLLRGGVVSSDL